MRATVGIAGLAAATISTTVSATSSTPAQSFVGSVALGDWEPAYQKALAFAANLTLAQKSSIVNGGNATSPTTGEFFPGIEISDGQEGPQNQYFVTGWGQPASLSMTFDREAIYEQARSVALEFYVRGYSACDGPTSSPLGRIAWGGRQSDAWAFDTFLNGVAFGLAAKAELSVGVLPIGKHFLLYEQETDRTDAPSNPYNLTAYSSNADDKTIHETYLAPWYDAVKNGLSATMCAMTAVNGTYSCENAALLQGLLKGEVGFPGFVVPDITGQHTTAGSANAGLDWADNQLWTVDIVEELVTAGNISEARLNDMVIRNIIGWFRADLNNGSLPTVADTGAYRPVPNIQEHRALNRLNGAKAMVLLKNTGNVLPLTAPKTLSIFGPHAGPALFGPNFQMTIDGEPPVFPGHMASPGGSAEAPLPYLVTPLQALTVRAAANGTQLRWILANNYTTSTANSLFTLGADETGTSPSIANYATDSEVCLVFMNAWAGEGADRSELRNAEQDSLVLQVAAQCNNTIVVINSVGPRILDTWIEHENVTGVLYVGALGQESGNAIVDVLYGDYNPSGRLAYTIARNESDYNATPCTTVWCDFTEGNYIDYKHFNKYNITPRYEFGFGLSYTSFAFSHLSLDSSHATAGPAIGTPSVGGRADLWDDVVSISFKLANTGDRDGAQIAQVYLSFPEEADQPIVQLKGFERVFLAAGKSSHVEITLHRRDISYWDVVAQEWTVAKGEYTVYVGASSKDFQLQQTFNV